MAQSTPRSPQNRGPKPSGSGKKSTGPSSARGTGAPPVKKAASAATASKVAPAKKAPPRKPGRSIVNQKQRPWGLITTAAVITVLAIALIGYAVIHKGSKVGTVAGYTNPEIPDAKAIPGLVYKPEPNHTHVEGVIKYDTTPPTGGNHSQYWADCSGTVYPNAIANENAVHMLEHGAVWITYKEGLPADQVAILAKKVTGVQRMAMSPYPDLKTNVSLQSWDYQLFVDSVNDPRIDQFILALRFNTKTTPEATASCSQPTFITNPSTFGHPLWVPVNSSASAPTAVSGSSTVTSSASTPASAASSP